MSGARDLLAVVDTVVGTFRRRDIVYFITGSFASSIHGEFRATNDLDIVAELDASQLGPLFDDLSHDFVADVDQAVRALESGFNFNLIHRSSYLKVDVFPCRSAFDREAARRAETIVVPGGTESLRVASREDILLAKLRWFRLGGESSETQQRDVQRLIALNRGEFDEDYLRRWAGLLQVDDLLERFLA
ncbi:MAG: hypothetical protein ABR543_19410 [Gemmatimonadaceae bacterium]